MTTATFPKNTAVRKAIDLEKASHQCQQLREVKPASVEAMQRSVEHEFADGHLLRVGKVAALVGLSAG